METEAKQALFWDLADALIARGRAERGTLMGFPCLRADGDFFAMTDHRSGDLVVKLPADRVSKLVGGGAGMPFAPAGRVFREWVAIEDADEAGWQSLLEEARAFVAS